MALDRITLTRFRNHAASRLEGSAQLNLLVGENGAGKTNVLEAISLFAPGRGLRRAALTEMASASGDEQLRGQRGARLRRRARARAARDRHCAPSGPGGGWCRSTAPRRARSGSANGSRSAG